MKKPVVAALFVSALVASVPALAQTPDSARTPSATPGYSMDATTGSRTTSTSPTTGSTSTHKKKKAKKMKTTPTNAPSSGSPDNMSSATTPNTK